MTDDIKEPPHDDNAEKALIGCVLLDNRVIAEVGDTIRAKMFYRESHRHIWRSIIGLADEGEDVDVVTLCSKLDDIGRLDKVGGANVIARLSNEVPSTANAKSYARIVREMYMRREMLAVVSDVQHNLYKQDGMDSEKAADKLTQACQLVTQTTVDDEDPSFKRHAGDWIERIEAIYRGEDMGGIPTGIEPYDDLTGGMFMQRFTGIAGLPGIGKSKLAFRIVEELVSEHGFAADIWYTDGAGWAIAREMAVARSGALDTTVLENPKLMNEHQWADLTKQIAHIKDMPGRVFQKGTPHIRDIALTTKARLAEIGDQPMVLVVDYCQNVTAGHSGANAERLNITDVSRTLAALRTDHENLTVIGLMQFTKAAENKAIPTPGDLYGSSQLEKDLDHLLIFHRPDEKDEEATQEDKRAGILWHAKTKHGPSGKRMMYCDLGKNIFAELDDRY
jgi:replicative DNA helicase